MEQKERWVWVLIVACLIYYILESKEPSRSSTVRVQEQSKSEYGFLLVSDLDEASRQEKSGEWLAWLQKGKVRRKPDGRYAIEMGEKGKLTSKSSTKNRGMELSEVVVFRGQ